MRKPDGWQTIETAPRDGTDVLLWSIMWDMTWGVQIGQYRLGQWHTGEGSVDDNEPGFDPEAEVDPEDFDPIEDGNIGPTHWHPVPAPPLARSS